MWAVKQQESRKGQIACVVILKTYCFLGKGEEMSVIAPAINDLGGC